MANTNPEYLTVGPLSQMTIPNSKLDNPYGYFEQDMVCPLYTANKGWSTVGRVPIPANGSLVKLTFQGGKLGSLCTASKAFARFVNGSGTVVCATGILASTLQALRSLAITAAQVPQETTKGYIGLQLKTSTTISVANVHGRVIWKIAHPS